MKQTAADQSAAGVRQVTILKCDIVNSTAVTSALDLESQLRFERGFHDLVKGLADGAQADMERFEGDGAFLIFGLSRPREDAAVSALVLARKLVRRVGAWRIIPGVRLQIRVGVASGAVAAIPHSPLHSIAGHTINRAQRLQQAASPDEILLCDQTRSLARGFFHYESRGRVAAKGFEGGVEAWRLIGEAPISSSFRATRSHGAIVGREAMLGALAGHWRDAMAGRAAFAWLSGEAGVGKSRLAHAALAAAEDAGAVILTLDCAPRTHNTPLFPVAVLLRLSAGLTSAMGPDEAIARFRTLLQGLVPPDTVSEALSYLGPLLQLPVEAPTAVAPSPEVQERTIAFLVGIVAGLLTNRPGLLLCEDLHWADDSTLRLVARLHARLRDRQVLILATSREPPAKVLADLPSDVLEDLSSVIELPVAPLDADAALTLVRRLAGAAALDEADAEAIVARCEGVPLLIEELTRAAVEREPGEAPARTIPADGVPLSLQLVVEARLVQNPHLAAAVRTASVLGREVNLPLLAHLTETDAGTPGLLMEAGFFDGPAAGGEHARFRHAMICEAVYETVLPEQRRTIHSRIADALQGSFAGGPDATPELLAEHLRRADRFREAIDVRLQAAKDTAERGAYVESEGHCEAGILMTAELADEKEALLLRFRLTVQMGIAMSGRLGYSAAEVKKTYLRAFALSESDVADKELYPVVRGLAAINLLLGDLQNGYELSLLGLDIAERIVERTDDRWEGMTFVIDALSLLSYTSFYYRPYAETLRWIERCLETYDENDGPARSYPMPHDAATAAMGVLPTVVWMLGDPAGADAAFQRCVEHLKRIGRDIDLALMQCWFSGFRITQQRWADCGAHAEIGLRRGEAFATWRDLAVISGALAEAHRTAAPEDVRQAIAALDSYAASGAMVNIAHYCLGIAHACVKAGETQLAHAMVERGLAIAERCAERRMVAELTILKATLEPDDDTAIALLQEALEEAEDFGSVAIALLACASLAVRRRVPAAEVARETLALFAGADPPEQDWMRPRLAVLRDAVRPAAELASA